jgi:hypothetical protein
VAAHASKGARGTREDGRNDGGGLSARSAQGRHAGDQQHIVSQSRPENVQFREHNPQQTLQNVQQSQQQKQQQQQQQQSLQQQKMIQQQQQQQQQQHQIRQQQQKQYTRQQSPLPGRPEPQYLNLQTMSDTRPIDSAHSAHYTSPAITPRGAQPHQHYYQSSTPQPKPTSSNWR